MWKYTPLGNTSLPNNVGGQGRKTSIAYFSTKRNRNEHIPPARAKASPIGGASGEEGNFPVCQGLPSIGEVARRRRDGEVLFRCGSRAGCPPYNLSVIATRCQLPQRESLRRITLSFVQIHRKLCRKGAVCGQNAKKSLSLLPNGAKRAIL